MNGPATITANFTASAGTVAVTVTSAPAGLSLTVDGAACTTPCARQWAAGSSHTVAAASPQAGTAGTQYVFGNWSDGGAASHTITGPASATTYTATFATQYLLTTAASPQAGGTICRRAVVQRGVGGGGERRRQQRLSIRRILGSVNRNGDAAEPDDERAANRHGHVHGQTPLNWYSAGGTWTNRKAITIDQRKWREGRR